MSDRRPQTDREIKKLAEQVALSAGAAPPGQSGAYTPVNRPLSAQPKMLRVQELDATGVRHLWLLLAAAGLAIASIPFWL